MHTLVYYTAKLDINVQAAKENSLFQIKITEKFCIYYFLCYICHDKQKT